MHTGQDKTHRNIEMQGKVFGKQTKKVTRVAGIDLHALDLVGWARMAESHRKMIWAMENHHDCMG